MTDRTEYRERDPTRGSDRDRTEVFTSDQDLFILVPPLPLRQAKSLVASCVIWFLVIGSPTLAARLGWTGAKVAFLGAVEAGRDRPDESDRADWGAAIDSYPVG
jgi:hypothetical protein